MERRAFLLGAGAVLLQACARRPELETRKPETASARLARELHALPQSPIKRSLLARVIPLYTPPVPSAITLGGIEFKINKAEVHQSFGVAPDNELTGTYTPRFEVSSSLYKLVGPVAVKLPLVGLLREDEMGIIPPQNVLPDGTPFATVNFQDTTNIEVGLAPRINVSVTWDGKPQNTLVADALITWGHVKEACSTLLDLVRMEWAIEKMKEHGLPTHFDAIDNRGRPVEIHGLSDAFLIIFNNTGRWQASLDIAGYLLSLKALANTQTYRVLIASNVVNPSLVSLIEGAVLSNTEKEFVKQSFDWAISTPQARQFSHQGDMDKIP